MDNLHKQQWEKYCKEELARAIPILTTHGITLDTEQPHIHGERYLMQAVQTKSGRKLILLGRETKTNKKVVIKATSDILGIKEIEHERNCRKTLEDIHFSYSNFLTPKELLFTKKQSVVVVVQEFIEQDLPFLERTTQEQFRFAMQAFENQEATHAATYEHRKKIEKLFGNMNAKKYLKQYSLFRKNIKDIIAHNKKLHKLLDIGKAELEKNTTVLEQYCGFLTHTDFVPHNFKIRDGHMYFLDLSSLRFGNKYEGWARFLNFMTLYNGELEDALLFYVKNNRASEEYESLRLMRIFRLAEIIWFYVSLLQKTDGNQRILTEARITFWTEVLDATLRHESVSKEIVGRYKTSRDALRNQDELVRQKGLH